MNKGKKVAIIVGVVLAIVILLLSLSIVFLSEKDNSNNDNKNNYSDNVKIKDNVNIITSETDIDFPCFPLSSSFHISVEFLNYIVMDTHRISTSGPECYGKDFCH